MYNSDESKDENEPSEDIDPIMLKKKGITLRCYQRKALKWMMNREEHANENNNQEDINYSIRNVLGQITYKGKINAGSNSKVDLSHLNSGVYTIEFDSENQLSNQKLIIQ